jgi:hypothetical protein
MAQGARFPAENRADIRVEDIMPRLTFVLAI